MTTEKNTKPGYLFQASMQIGEGIALTVSGNLPEGSTSKDMVAETDKVLEALEKQNIKRMKIPAIMGALKDQEDALTRTIEHYEKLKSQEQAGKKLTAGERAQLETCATQIENIGKQVAKGKAILAEMEKEVA